MKYHHAQRYLRKKQNTLSKWLRKKSQKLKKDIILERKVLTRKIVRIANTAKRSFSRMSPKRRKDMVSLAALAIVIIVLGVSIWHKHQPTPADKYSMALSHSVALESRWFIGGDVYWGRRMHDWSQESKHKEAYPFARLAEFQRQNYDAWVANLECPAVPSVKQPVGYDPGLTGFNCDTQYIPEAAKWFDVFSLANNHTQNQNREAGLNETRIILENNEIQHFGNFNPHIKRDVCEVVAIPARTMLNGKQEAIRLPVAFCGYHGVYYTITDESIAVMQQYSKYMPVIAFPHMGQEYQAVADDVRRGLYRKMIDNGADAVIGNHPHWVQPTEAYRGKLIVYSLGNFIFDQQFNEEVTRSAAIGVTLRVPQGTSNSGSVAEWAQLGPRCVAFQDDCLAEAANLGLSRLPFTLDYHVVGVDTSDKITKRANMRAYEAILRRLNWSETINSLAR